MTIANDLKNKHYALITPAYEPIERRQAVVFEFDGATRTCTVFLAGSERPIPDVKFLNSYFPVPGDTVWVDIKGVDMMIVGTALNYEWQAYNTTLTGMSPGNHGQIFDRQGANCSVDFNFQWTGTSGTATVFGFTLPFPASGTMLEYVGSMHFLDDSTGAHKAGICYVKANTQKVEFVGPTGIVSGNFGLDSVLVAADDTLVCTIDYQVAPGY